MIQIFLIPRRIMGCIKRSIPLFRYLGIRVAFPLLVYEIRKVCLPVPKQYRILEKKHQYIENYLRERYIPIVNRYKNEPAKPCEPVFEEKPIWICWWQGYENMPDILKECVESIRRNAGKHPVTLISKMNYAEFVDIPQVVLERLESGSLILQHFADILRCCLLERYGGLWMDATLYVTKKIPEYYFNSPFFSLKSIPIDNSSVSCYRWSTFLLGTNGATSFFSCLTDLLIAYVSQHSKEIDYLLIDYFMDIMFQSNPEYEKLLENLPISNLQLHQLRLYLNEAYDEKEYKKITRDTLVFKLTYKWKLLDYTKEGKPTFYNHLLNRSF